MANVLLIIPNYYDNIFARSKTRAAISRGTPQLGIACIAAPLLKTRHNVKIVNLNLASNPGNCLLKVMRGFEPDLAGITATTPLIKNAYQIAELIKKFNDRIYVVAGGPHPSALPKEVLTESKMDCVIMGEGDFIFKKIVENGPSSTVPNIFFKKNGEVIESEIQNNFIENLDALPFPAYELFDISKYSQPKISSKKSPLGYIETSRGCYAKCIFCNKNIHGNKVRMKSPVRIVDEMEHMLKLGFKELHIVDDIFTADMKRAYCICEEILRRNLNFPWYPRGGVRVDRISYELLKIMKRAGCYRIPFGIESGSQRVIDKINKRITIEQAIDAVRMAKMAGLETECYFMLGLPTETADDIKMTVEFAIKLNPDYAKFAIAVPLPGTKMFDDMWAAGQIKTRDWDKYNFSVSAGDLYQHDLLTSELVDKYYSLSHRRFYFRPSYIYRMIYKTIAKGTIFAHIKAFLKTRW